MSVDFETIGEKRRTDRLTIVGMWGRYVLKTPTEQYRSLPDLEDMTMHIAGLLKIRTVGDRPPERKS